ncbi:MAG: NAD(P)-dependent oxidoreductase [Anaerolineales bacterium]|nr:NAD(P)-dependent oxidoreductase [Anaerolineales bacterium]
MANLGFIGLGMMGSRIARRLLAAGHTVTGYNRTRSKVQSLLEAGLRWADSPRAVAEAADITFSMVSDSAALSLVADGPEGILAGLSTGKLYVDMSTVSPRLVRELADKVVAKGARMLEAPVSGSIPAAESGTLTFFVGGDAEALDRVRPVLETLGQKIVHVGGNGQGVSMKIAINLNLATQLVSLFESLLLAERSGIPRAAALEALLNSVAASPAMKYRAPFIFNLPSEVWFSVEMMQKDLQLALELGRELAVPLPSVAHANEMLTAARALGYGAEDFAALFKVAARMAGVSL